MVIRRERGWEGGEGKGITQFFIAGLTIEQTVDGQVMTYPAGSQIFITDVGESTPTSGGALVCRTDRDDCCRNDPQAGETRQGNWTYPNGNLVDDGSGDDIYRTREASTVLLNRRNGATGPTGLYCCEVASVADPDARICINLSKI